MTTPHRRIPYLPARIEGLSALAINLSWSWSREARALFRSIDEALWHLTRHNPLELLCRVDPARIAACASDRDFLRRYDEVMARLARRDRPASDTWFARSLSRAATAGRSPTSAPSSACTTRCRSTPAASACWPATTARRRRDLGVPLVGVGLFYTKGYFDQRLRLDGWQEDSDEQFDLSLTPLVAAHRAEAASRTSPWCETFGPAGARAGLADAWSGGCRSTCSTPTSR